MNLEVCGHRVLIKPAPVEEVSKGGIVLAVEGTNEHKLTKGATVKGTIVAVGPNAWLAFDDGKPWAKVGDEVYYAKYAGKWVGQGEDEYLIINDEDIQCVIKEEA